jgi:hypothetical protein
MTHKAIKNTVTANKVTKTAARPYASASENKNAHNPDKTVLTRGIKITVNKKAQANGAIMPSMRAKDKTNNTATTAMFAETAFIPLICLGDNATITPYRTARAIIYRLLSPNVEKPQKRVFIPPPRRNNFCIFCPTRMGMARSARLRAWF